MIDEVMIGLIDAEQRAKFVFEKARDEKEAAEKAYASVRSEINHKCLAIRTLNMATAEAVSRRCQRLYEQVAQEKNVRY